MPSKSYFWYTTHDDLVLLHINSTDPRRMGEETLAMFNIEAYASMIGNEWKERGKVIVNQFGESLLSLLSQAYGFGKSYIQIEPNCDFTKANYRKRTGTSANAQALLEYMKDPNWKEKRLETKYNPPCHDRIRTKSQTEWVELPVNVDDGVVIKIKVNKRHAHFIPTRLVYRPKRKNSLYLVPNRQQNKRKKYADDRRHGRALTEHLLDMTEGSTSRVAREDPFDYRIDLTNGRFLSEIRVKNVFHQCELGIVLEIHYPSGLAKEWSECRSNVKPEQSIIFEGIERKAYFLVDENMRSYIVDQDWESFNGGDDAYCPTFKIENGNHKRMLLLKKLVCEVNGALIGAQTVASRMTKGYEIALNKGIKGYAKRAEYENRIMTDQTTSNRMYTKKRDLAFRTVHCDKYVAIPELGITALDVRFQSIRIGGKK
jgi:hypothetical protein